jgi:hypothetical protein
MRKAWMFLTGLLAAGILLFMIGCSKDSEDNSGPATDQEALTQAVGDDQDLEGMDAWTDDSDGSLDEAITPLRWTRVGHRSNPSYQVEIQGDTLATITRTIYFNGQLRILTDTTGGVRTFVTKEMHNVLVRKLHARRIGRPGNRRENWRVWEITPEVMRSSAPDTSTVWPVRVEIFRRGEDGMDSVTTFTDPLNTYYRRDTLPVVYEGDSIVVRAWPNLDAESIVAVLHPRVYRNGPHPRILMTNDNGVFAASSIVGSRVGVHAAGVDFINRAALYDSEARYDAGGWALAYRVIPRQ